MDPSTEKNSSAVKPTRARHMVLLFAATLSVITYVDRVCIAKAKGPISADLHLSDLQMGYVFGAFTLAYAIFEIPGGWLGDVIGPRKVLMRIVVWWSFFTAATGWAWSFVSLLVTRFLFGAGEAGCYPNLAKMFTNWLPSRERSRAVAVMWVSSRWGGAFTPLLVVWVITLMSWRWAFGLFGAIGLVWAVVFYWWFRDYPRDHKSVNAAEFALLGDQRTAAPPVSASEISGSALYDKQRAPTHVRIPWSKLFRSRTVWLLWVQYFCFGYGWYFYITWLPTYLEQARGASIKNSLTWLPELLGNHLQARTIADLQVALLAGIPLFFGGIGCLVSGWLATRLAKRNYDVARTRRVIACFGYWGSAVMLLLSPYIADPVWAMLAMGLASFSLDLALVVCWSTAVDVGGRYAGTVSGNMNMAGQIGGSAGPVAVGYILHYLNNNWLLTFWISSIIYVVGGLCWMFIDPVTPLEREEENV